MNEPSEYSFEAGTMRHAPKLSGDSAGATIDIEKSREGAEAAARALLASLEASPPGTVMALQPSNIKRTDETRALVVATLTRLVGDRTDISILELGEDVASSEQALETIAAQPERKIILTDIRATELLGFDPESKNVATINALHDRIKVDQGFEAIAGKFWASRPQERTKIVADLQDRGIEIKPEEIVPSDFEEPPERVALRQIRWMRAMERIGQSRFPGRPLKIEAVSHNIRADFTALALLGHDISATNIDQVLGGSLRAPFERSSVAIDARGVTVRFRDQEKHYSPEQFDQLLQNLAQRAEERRTEWAR